MKRLVAIDLDPELVKWARHRLAGYPREQVEVRLGDATAIEAADQTFDAVVNFAALHHVPNWQKAVSEIYRVLKPGGRFFFEEVTWQWIKRWPWRRLFMHPMENRFSGAEFVKELERQGFAIGENHVEKSGGDFIFGVGRKK